MLHGRSVLLLEEERDWVNALPVMLVIEEHSLFEEVQFGFILRFVCFVRFNTDSLAFQIFVEGKLERKNKKKDTQ